MALRLTDAEVDQVANTIETLEEQCRKLESALRSFTYQSDIMGYYMDSSMWNSVVSPLLSKEQE